MYNTTHRQEGQLPLCPFKVRIDIYNFLMEVPLIKEKTPWYPCPFKSEALGLNTNR